MVENQSPSGLAGTGMGSVPPSLIPANPIRYQFGPSKAHRCLSIYIETCNCNPNLSILQSIPQPPAPSHSRTFTFTAAPPASQQGSNCRPAARCLSGSTSTLRPPSVRPGLQGPGVDVPPSTLQPPSSISVSLGDSAVRARPSQVGLVGALDPRHRSSQVTWIHLDLNCP